MKLRPPMSQAYRRIQLRNVSMLNDVRLMHDATPEGDDSRARARA